MTRVPPGVLLDSGRGLLSSSIISSNRVNLYPPTNADGELTVSAEYFWLKNQTDPQLELLVVKRQY
jgi:hypothetical protein